jgi:acyl carrier protein
MEEEFGTEIDDDEAQKLVKVQDAIDYISKHQ